MVLGVPILKHIKVLCTQHIIVQYLEEAKHLYISCGTVVDVVRYPEYVDKNVVLLQTT